MYSGRQFWPDLFGASLRNTQDTKYSTSKYILFRFFTVSKKGEVFFEFLLFPYEPYKSLRYATLPDVLKFLTSARLVSLKCL